MKIKTALMGAAAALMMSASANAADLTLKFGHVGKPGSLFEASVNAFAKCSNDALGSKAEVQTFGMRTSGVAIPFRIAVEVDMVAQIHKRIGFVRRNGGRVKVDLAPKLFGRKSGFVVGTGAATVEVFANDRERLRNSEAL